MMPEMRVVGLLPAAPRAALALLALAAPSAPASAPGSAPASTPETVVAGFDLLGWRRLGVLAVETPALDVGGAEALLDGDPRTFARAPGRTAQFALSFRPGQTVQRVTVVPAGETPARVTLTVVEEDGDRFQAGELDVAAGDSASFRLMDVLASALEVRVEREEGAGPAALADVLVEGRLEVTALMLEGVPESLPAGGSFPLRVLGRDAFGGRPDLTGLAQVIVQPPPALAFSGGRVVTRVQGPVSLEPRLGGLTGMIMPLLVTPLAPPPPAPLALPGMRVVELRLEGEPPFEVLRRESGQKQAVAVGRALSSTWYDDTVQPGAAYAYSVRRIDLLDNALTEPGPEARARTHGRLPPGMREVGRVPILLAVFTDSLQPGERAALLASVQAARLFAWRHTLGRVVLDPVVLDVPGPTPVTSGPTMVAVEARLRELGVRDGGFTVIAAVSREFEGDFAGFRVCGDAAGLLLRGTPVATPRGALGPDPGLAWSLLHELHHAAADLLLDAGGDPLPTGHLDQDFGALGLLGSTRGRPFDAGEAWDSQALLLAGFDGWTRLGWPRLRPLELLDTDGDLLPDEDERLPLDEARLGTDPRRADTDGDGLGDFAELAVDLYRGSDPLSGDSDGDGLRDGLDGWPTSNFTGVIAAGRTPRLVASVPTAARPDAPRIALSACWTRTALTLEVVTDEPSDVFVDLDGSGRLGRWESETDTGGAGAPAGDCWCGPMRLALRAHSAPLGVYLGGLPLRDALVAAEKGSDGRHRLVAVLPVSLGPGAADGLVPPFAPRADGPRLRAGTVLGLAVTVRPARLPEPEPFEPFPADGDWTSLFDTHHFMDALLQD
jgi:hypothetical protein